MSTGQASDRRARARYPVSSYTARLQGRGVWRFSRPLSARVLDFHHQGAALICDRPLRVGCRVKLTLHSVTETVYGIHAWVRHVRKTHEGFCVGLSFQPRRRGAEPDESILQALEQCIRVRR